MGFLRSLRPLDVVAMLIAVGATVASVVVWDYGKVDIGMTLAVDDHGLTDPTGVIVADVTPDGNAARHGISPMSWVIDLTTTTGRDVLRVDPIKATADGSYVPPQRAPWDLLQPTIVELSTTPVDFAPPMEAVDSADIESATIGQYDRESRWVYTFSSINRSALQVELSNSIWALVLGAAIGLGVWRFLGRGPGSTIGRQMAILVAVAAAVPFLLLPVAQVGNPLGIYASYVLPTAAATLMGVKLALENPDASLRRTAVAAVAVAAAITVVQVVRYMTASELLTTDRAGILLAITGVTALPAAMLVATRRDDLRERLGAGSLALVPAAAVTVFTQPRLDVALPVGLLGLLLGGQLLPMERMRNAVVDAVSATVGHEGEVVAGEAGVRWRDTTLIVLFGLVTAAGALHYNGWAAMLGVVLAAVVWMAVRGGFLGPWRDGAIPLAAAVGIPVSLVAYGGVMWGSSWVALFLASTLAALAVAHVLARRVADPRVRLRLLAAAAVMGLVGLVLLVVAGSSLSLLALGLVPLVPGIPLAVSEAGGTSRAVRDRLETLVVALTPGAAATALISSVGPLLLVLWLIAVAIWRQFTLNPLLAFAQRTQLQRDVAVAAAETERARLAADLHDDALQQLTMLVRTLDEGGHAKEADEAREIATKLRSVVGDLRLPILDDLGAGAALEWLVERVEPLAGGPIKLDRSDESRPPANVELAVFRVAQEALTNAIKHGRPPIAVRYDVRTDGRVTLAVDDAGEGIGADAAESAPAEGHFGLLNMQQRAEQIGALLDVRRWPSGGTRVALEWRPQ